MAATPKYENCTSIVRSGGEFPTQPSAASWLLGFSRKCVWHGTCAFAVFRFRLLLFFYSTLRFYD